MTGNTLTIESLPLGNAAEIQPSASEIANLRHAKTVSAPMSVNIRRPNRCESLMGTLDFTPFDQAALSAKDKYLRAGGVLLVPDHSGEFPYEGIGCGKFPLIYVLDRETMEKLESSSNHGILQEVSQVWEAGGYHPEDCFMTPAFWPQTLYFAGINDVFKAFRLNRSTDKMSSYPISEGGFKSVLDDAHPVVSAKRASGIVWAVDFSSAVAVNAYDAKDLATELFESPSLGTGAKFVVPTVNGKVFVGRASKLFLFRKSERSLLT